jgi:hypothetical protein
MTPDFVLVKADVSVTWSGDPPNIRVYVGDELFTERTWVWQEEYLEELLQIYAPPGVYDLRWQVVAPAQAEIEVKNVRIDTGPEGACIVDNSQLRIA